MFYCYGMSDNVFWSADLSEQQIKAIVATITVECPQRVEILDTKVFYLDPGQPWILQTEEPYLFKVGEYEFWLLLSTFHSLFGIWTRQPKTVIEGIMVPNRLGPLYLSKKLYQDVSIELRRIFDNLKDEVSQKSYNRMTALTDLEDALATLSDDC